MEKIYIVSSTNESEGYTQSEILTVFSTKEKAKKFIQQEKERIFNEIKESGLHYEVISNTETYFFIDAEHQNYWFEILLIEKILN